MFKYLFSLISLISVTNSLLAQDDFVEEQIEEREEENEIAEDSLTDFGPTTTYFFTESDLRARVDTNYVIDTTLIGVHRWMYDFDKNGEPYQDLNGIGSANRSIYYKVPDRLGREFGFNVYNRYVPEQQTIKLYDTKGPYSNVHYFQDFNGQRSAGIIFSQNVNYHSNVSLDLKKYAAERLQGANPNNEKFTDNYTINLNGWFRSVDSSYFGTVSFNYFNHSVFENWGGDTSEIANYYETFFQPRVVAEEIEAEDRRSHVHLYHQFAPFRGSELFQIFHSFDRVRRKNIYRDQLVQSHIDLYDNIYFDSLRTNDSTVFTEYSNTFGFQGGKRNYYYSGYLRDRRFKVDRGDSVGDNWETEQYLGGSVLVRFDKLKLGGRAEIALDGQTLFDAHGEIFGLRGHIKNVVKKTSVLERRYWSNHHLYVNEFDYEVYRSFTLSYEGKFKNWRFRPYYELMESREKVYFNGEDFLQDNQSTVTSSLGITISGNWKRLFLKEYFRYYDATESDWFEAPKLYSWTELYYQFNFVRPKYNIELQIGFDFWYRSAWKGYGYDPSIQQFYVQDDFILKEAFVTDFFINAKVMHFKFFAKLNYLNQRSNEVLDFLPYGYFTTPYYHGQSQNLEVGLIWMFFD